MIDWHRLFGLALCDLFAGSPWTVELEKDLSQKRQPLDVVILRRGPGEFAGRLPDGLEHLADHNLLSYKSLHEPLEGIAVPYTIKDFRREYLAELSPEERLEGLSPDQRLQGLSPNQRLQGLSPEEIKAYLKKLEQAKKPRRPAPRKSRNPGRRNGKK